MERNIRKVQRQLFINKQASRSEIESGTELSYQQVHRAVDRMVDSDLVKIVDNEDTRGGIQNKDILELTSKGFNDARDRSLNDDPQVENAEEIEKLKQEIINLRSGLNDAQTDLTEWMKYSSNWNDVAQKRFETIEKRLGLIEEELGISE